MSRKDLLIIAIAFRQMSDDYLIDKFSTTDVKQIFADYNNEIDYILNVCYEFVDNAIK